MQRSWHRKEQSALVFVLKGLMVPYSNANLLLAFKPGLFFIELEKISRLKKRTLQNAFYAAQKQELIKKEEAVYRLTELGRKTIAPYTAQNLPRDGKFMVAFDIPENMATTRSRFRRILKTWNFQRIQKSVWVTTYDHRDSVKDLVAELSLDDYVVLYECSPI